jgi:hypothetical protein
LYNPSQCQGDCTDVKIELHPTRRFYKHLDVLLDALGDDETFNDDLAKALKSLHESGWDRSFESHGNSGSDFSYPINSEFVLIFRRTTDRYDEGKPKLIHFYLKTIERRSK